MNLPNNYNLKTQELTKFVKKQSENQRFMKTLETSATFFLITIFGLFAIRPTFVTISALIGEIKAKEILASQMRDRIKSVVKAQENYALVQEKYSIIESSLPDGYRFYNSSSQFQAAFQNNQMKPRQISYGFQSVANKQPNTNLDNYTLRTGTSSDFSQILNFIGKILNIKRLIDINQISFSLDNSSGSENPGGEVPSGEVNFDLNADVYYWNTGNE